MADTLKQSIILVNDFTVKRGGSGTSGSTPGQYVVRYMARELATETVAPIRRDDRLDDFAVRYMARRSATETLEGSVDDLKDAFADIQGLSGAAFGYGTPSLSHRDLVHGAKDIQARFDEGKTVLKTILSFDHDYLVRRGVVRAEDTEVVTVDSGRQRVIAAGDYRGKVDQMKLRMAIMQGLKRLAQEGRFDDMRYVGVIQVDTRSVHAHLAIVDAGVGRVTKDGEQRGMIHEREKRTLRRSIDMQLDAHQRTRHLASAVSYERTNVVSFVKSYAHRKMTEESLAQLLTASLPADKRKWRAGSKAEEMRKPNRLVRELVEDRLNEQDSPLGRAMARVQEYARRRRRTEGLARAEEKRLVENAREEIMQRSINGVYAVLRGLPEDWLEVRTPMLDVMTLDYERLKEAAQESRTDPADDGLVEFGFRLRSYSSRLRYHQEKRADYREKVRDYDSRAGIGMVSAESVVMRNHWAIEEEYHAKCASKYRHFLTFMPPESVWRNEWAEAEAYGRKVLGLEGLVADPYLRRVEDPERAEQIGQQVYGQHGGSLAGTVEGREQLRGRVAAMRERLAALEAAAREKLTDMGLGVEVVESGGDEAKQMDVRTLVRGGSLAEGSSDSPRTRTSAGVPDPRREAVVEVSVEHDWDEVRALDMHRLGFDFGRDVPVGPRAKAGFREMTRRRHEAVVAAAEYLVGTDQPDAASQLPVSDVMGAVELSSQLGRPDEEGTLPSEFVAAVRKVGPGPRSATTKLSRPLRAEIDAVSSRELAQLDEKVLDRWMSGPETSDVEAPATNVPEQGRQSPKPKERMDVERMLAELRRRHAQRRREERDRGLEDRADGAGGIAD